MNFSQFDVLAWLLMAGLVGIESTAAARYNWDETARWLTGWVTLFGTGAFVAVLGYWHLETVLFIAALSWAARTFVPFTIWRRREAHRWTAQYVLAFAVAMLPAALGSLSLETWAGLFVGLGVCGAIKTGLGGWRDSLQAQKLRDRKGQHGSKSRNV
jgi:hypothetical protein